MAIVENFPSFLADFGVAATVDGVAVTGIFDNSYVDSFGVVSASEPTLLCSSSSVSTAGTGDAVSVVGTSYKVAGIQPDGTGMTRLVLQEA
jgi:hypothetical protein